MERYFDSEDSLRPGKRIGGNGDDVTCAWFQYNFEDGDSAAFMKVLEKHQREDGGFGGLLYEFDYQSSCLKCTEHTFRYMLYLKERPSADDPVIQKMMKYLLERYRPTLAAGASF